ncbi:MAG TPA: pirin family protein [Candidatus Baltobacteraceae bacterium]|nr:pirin family protein [Candidatus Baltobacteraceae bacterium]
MKTALSPVFAVQRAAERAGFDHGWLRTYHSFSFAEYVDPNNLNWGALRVFNDDTIAGSGGFPMHPHRDMEIVTYVLSGELAHRDSMGNEGVVGAGGVQFMSAGTGVRHSEYNNRADDPLHLVQMWVLPGTLGGAPSYGQRDFTIDDRRNRWLTIASGQPGVDAPIAITQRATFKVARLENASLVAEFAPKRYGFLFVADGKVEANGESLGAGDAVRLFDVERLALEGSGELVLWDLPDADV